MSESKQIITEKVNASYKPSTEKQRDAEQDAVNTTRFFLYNNERAKHGLAHFSYCDYLMRKHTPRDNFSLATR